MKFFFATCFLTSVFLVPSLHAEPKSSLRLEGSVYVKIILPGKAPAKGKRRVVEPWIEKELQAKGEKELRAVTGWVSLSATEGESIEVWDGLVDGKTWGCSVDGLLEKERTSKGNFQIFLSGWSPVGPEVETQALSPKPGSREILFVDVGMKRSSPQDRAGIAYAVLSVGLPSFEKPQKE